jgi:hypothetical protein
MSDLREGEEFFLNVPEKLDNPFPDLKYFREQRPVFYIIHRCKPGLFFATTMSARCFTTQGSALIA